MCPPSSRLFGDGGAETMFVILQFMIRPKLGEGRNNRNDTNKLVLCGEMLISARDTCSYLQLHAISPCTKGILLDAGCITPSYR